MDEFGTFKGLYQKATRLEEIASMKGIKSEIKELIRDEAKDLREIADCIEPQKMALVASDFVEPYRAGAGADPAKL